MPSAGSSAVGAFLLAALYSGTPLALAAMGGVLSERSGVVNIALEGFMLIGAFTAIWFGGRSAGAGLGAAVAAGILFGLLHAFLTQKTRMDHVLSGLGINLLAYGATQFLYLRLYPSGVEVGGLPRWYFLAAAIAAPPSVWFLLYRTPFGLRLRAAGEGPESERMAGVDPVARRFTAVALSGALAAFAGAYLSLGEAHTFSTGMSAGKGYVALAAVIFGKWNPLGAAGGALFFGVFYAMQTQLQISGIQYRFLGIVWTSPFLLDTLPYFMTLVALVGVVGKASPPAALGRPDSE